jgi:hypothetical protein
LGQIKGYKSTKLVFPSSHFISSSFCVQRHRIPNKKGPPFFVGYSVSLNTKRRRNEVTTWKDQFCGFVALDLAQDVGGVSHLLYSSKLIFKYRQEPVLLSSAFISVSFVCGVAKMAVTLCRLWHPRLRNTSQYCLSTLRLFRAVSRVVNLRC